MKVKKVENYPTSKTHFDKNVDLSVFIILPQMMNVDCSSVVDFDGRIVDSHGVIMYFKEGSLHSYNDEPALIYKSGMNVWYRNGKKHREDGPAMYNPKNEKFTEFFLNGVWHPFEEYLKKIESEEQRIMLAMKYYKSTSDEWVELDI